jgi:hypothetical protein
MECCIDHVLPAAYLRITFRAVTARLEDAFLMTDPDRGAAFALVETLHLPLGRARRIAFRSEPAHAPSLLGDAPIDLLQFDIQHLTCPRIESFQMGNISLPSKGDGVLREKLGSRARQQSIGTDEHAPSKPITAI